ncbi:MAG TPA: hypothetical protein VN688_17370 [Gemmataceae bacterium]|nr:hypothetical protein [Gemmataceae bacterium]
MRTPVLVLFFAILTAAPLRAAEKPPIYLWLEAEWFEGVSGSFAYWTGTAKPTGSWGVAGPGISPEWTQGGESEWNSLGAPATETKAECHRDVTIPRPGKYRVWVRYVDHRKKTEPFTVVVAQGERTAKTAELGIKSVVPVNDEYQLYWGFSFGWGFVDAELARGPARVRLVIDKAGEAWRQVDAVLLTDDLAYTPVGREKPPFAYLAAMNRRPAPGTNWRGSAKELLATPPSARPALAKRDFSMWTGASADAKWWKIQKIPSLTLADVFYNSSPPADIRKEFHKQFKQPRDVSFINWPHLLPGFYLGESPDLSPGSPLRKWLEQSKTPFYIMTNYAAGAYTDKNGPGTYAALTGPLASQFLGYIHGEAIGSTGVGLPDKALGKTRAEHLAALSKQLRISQARQWSKIYKTPVPEDHWNKGIPCLSVDSIALAHVLHDMGSHVIGYEEDSTNYHVPMRIAFERGAARQYGGAWINYASGNFGDACNYFSQEPQVPRGAKSWFHSKYAVTDGVSASWYRKLYYLNYLGGASAIFWEQSLANQWILPGPGTHPIQLSPFGRATEDFQAFVSRLPERGEPVTPVAFLLSHAHGYEPVNYRCKMLNVFPMSRADLELRELFNVCWYPAGVMEGKPAAPDVQSMPSGVYGNIFDVLVDRPAHARAIFHYPVVWLAGDVDLSGAWPALLEEYVRKGGTLVLSIEAARALPPKLLGLRPTGKTRIAEQWQPEGGEIRSATPFEVAEVERDGATVLAWATPKTPLLTRHVVGEGAVIVALVPRLLGQDERAHPALPYLMNGLTAKLLPIEVRRADGTPLRGEVLYQINKTRDGYLVLLVNNRGVDKTPNGVARVDRRAFVDVVVRTTLPVKSAREHTEPRALNPVKGEAGTEVRLRVHPGDVQVVGFTLEK